MKPNRIVYYNTTLYDGKSSVCLEKRPRYPCELITLKNIECHVKLIDTQDDNGKEFRYKSWSASWSCRIILKEAS